MEMLSVKEIYHLTDTINDPKIYNKLRESFTDREIQKQANAQIYIQTYTPNLTDMLFK